MRGFGARAAAVVLIGCTPARWEVVATEIGGGVMLAAATLGDEVVISGGSYDETGSLWRYDGERVCVEEDAAEAALWWVAGEASDWYAVGEQAIVIHDAGGVRTREDLPGKDITLFGVAPQGDDVWAVGGSVEADRGEIWRKVGDAWSLVAEPPGIAFKVHDGWVVGDGFVWAWDGEAFVDRTPPDAPRLLTVRVRSASDVWAVGGSARPQFWHWDGTDWTEPELVPACVAQPLNGVFTAPGDEVWVTGNFGTAAAWDGEAWSCADFPITSEHFHAIWRWNDEVLAVGGNLFASQGHYGTIARHGGRGAVTVDGACDP